MNVPLWVWIITVAVILAMLAVDYLGHVRTPHAPTLRESATWSLAYVAVALVFGVIVWIAWGGTYGGEYFAGYITEKSLSVDNGQGLATCAHNAAHIGNFRFGYALCCTDH